MSLVAVNVLLILLGPPAIVGILLAVARWSRNADAERARVLARAGELQVQAAEKEVNR